MQNITISMNEDLLKAGRKYAQEHHVSFNAFLRHLLAKAVLKTTRKEWLKECYKDLAMIDSIQADFKSALKNYKLYVIYRDSLFNEENMKKQTQTEMQFQFDKKESDTKAEQDKKDVITKEEK